MSLVDMKLFEMIVQIQSIYCQSNLQIQKKHCCPQIAKASRGRTATTHRNLRRLQQGSYLLYRHYINIIESNHSIYKAYIFNIGQRSTDSQQFVTDLISQEFVCLLIM